MGQHQQAAAMLILTGPRGALALALSLALRITSRLRPQPSPDLTRRPDLTLGPDPEQAAAAMPNRATAAGSGVARPTGPQLQQLMHEHMNLQMMMRMQASA